MILNDSSQHRCPNYHIETLMNPRKITSSPPVLKTTEPVLVALVKQVKVCAFDGL